MKPYSLLIIILTFCLSAKAQDTLTLNNGTKIPAKVLEINPTTIKYKHGNNMTGPDYVEEKSNIKAIKYANGIIDSFTVVKATQIIQATNQPTVTIGKIIETPKKQHFTFNKIVSVDNKYYFVTENNERLPRAIGISKIMRTAHSLCIQKPSPALEESLRKTRQCKVRQTVFGIAGAPLCLIGFGTTLISGIILNESTYSSDTDPATVGVTIGAMMLTTGISFEIISGINGKKKQKRLKETVDLYNQNL